MEKEKKNDMVIVLNKRIVAVFGFLCILIVVFFAGTQYGADNNPVAVVPDDVSPEQPSAYPSEPAASGDIDDNPLYRDALQARPDDAKRGSGSVLLIEYSDYECPFCQRFHVTAQALVDSGAVTWIYRHLPLVSLHPTAEAGARIGECVRREKGNDAFWTYTDTVFEAGSLSVASYRSFGSAAGLSDSDMDACLAEGGAVAQFVAGHMSEAEGLEVYGTPGSFLVNPRTGAFARIPGAVPLGEIQGMLASIE